MIKINYPEKKPSIRTTDGIEFIFCIIRKRWIVITPEEWVRQNFLLYLIEVLRYPASLIAVEKKLTFADITKRFDIVVYDNNATALILVECKEMNVPLTEHTLSQVLRYNINVQANFLVVTNGSYCFGFEKNETGFQPAISIPAFK